MKVSEKLGRSESAETLNVKVEDGKTQDVSRQEDGCRMATELEQGEGVQARPEGKQEMSRQSSEEKKVSEKLGCSESAAMTTAADRALEKITHEKETSQQDLKEEKKKAMGMGM
jgi:hypothetical protein